MWRLSDSLWGGQCQKGEHCWPKMCKKLQMHKENKIEVQRKTSFLPNQAFLTI